MSNLLPWGTAGYDHLMDLAGGFGQPFGTSLARGSALHRLGEIREKFIGQFLGRTVDQPLPELGQLAADLRLDM